jgi:hypothetical protein
LTSGGTITTINIIYNKSYVVFFSGEFKLSLAIITWGLRHQTKDQYFQYIFGFLLITIEVIHLIYRQRLAYHIPIKITAQKCDRYELHSSNDIIDERLHQKLFTT